jgi:diacylglycerol kinase family enzyme
VTTAGAPTAPIPALVNPSSGSAPAALEALRADARFAAREVTPGDLATVLRELVAAGARRVVVSGGDGTIGAAAAVAAETGFELAVLPGGTLNHFALDLGLPADDLAACLEIAATGVPRRADLGEVNEHPILNSSAVGTYVDFVRTRESLERWLSYRLASVVAAVRVWLGIRGFAVEMRAVEQPAPENATAKPAALSTASGAAVRRYRTSLVFVGVGERELSGRRPGSRVPDGRPTLHAMVVRETRRARVAAVAWSALVRGLDAVAQTDSLDALLVEECVVHLRHTWARVSVDGELLRLRGPLRYRLVRDAFTVVGPPPGPGGGTARSS